jgi:hypothetical protein
MGLFSFFSRKRKNQASHVDQSGQSSPTSQRVESMPEKVWHHSLSSLTIVTHPLGETPGTIMERPFLYSSLTSITRAISRLHQEPESSTSLFFETAEILASKAAAEDLSLAHYETVGLTFDPTLGYSARMSADGKKFTILFGQAAPVARASTTFHSEITEAIQSSAGQGETFVLAIDGIAYAHLQLESVLH